MRILLAAKHAPHGSRPIGGVQSWCRTVANELSTRGHDVETWGPEQPLPIGVFDFGIIANLAEVYGVLHQCTKRVIVSHGIIPPESPFINKPFGDHVVFTSEEVRKHWAGSGTIIRQPIDLEFWLPEPGKKHFLTRFSYRGGLPFVPHLAQSMNLQYRHIRRDSPEIARKTLQRSACVLATGRAALEAMACGVPVVIADHRSAYQKPLMDLDVNSAMTRNYSGRGGTTPTINTITGAINAAMSRGNMRDHVKKYHNVTDIADQLLELA